MFDALKSKWTHMRSDANFSEIMTGSIWALAARVAAMGLGVVASMIIARIYGAEALGVVSVLYSFLLLTTLFTVLGTNTSMLRLIPEHIAKYSPASAFAVYRKTQYFVAGVSALVGGLLFWASGFVAGTIFSKPDLEPYFILGAVCIVFKSLMILNTQAVRGLRLIRGFALMLTLPQLFNLALLLILGSFFAGRDVPVYSLLGGFALTGITGCVIMQYAFKTMIRPDDTIRHTSMVEILSLSVAMLMTAAMHFLIGQTGIILLGMFRSAAEVGYYAVAVKLATLTSFILTAITSMAAPKFSELFHKGKMDELFSIAKKSAKLIFWTSTPILVLLLAFGRPVLGILFGRAFTVAYGAMAILVLGQFVNSVSGSTGMFMSMTGREKQFGGIMLFAAVINVLLNLLLIPRFGIVGSATAGMVSLSFWNITALAYIKHEHGQTTGYLPWVMGYG